MLAKLGKFRLPPEPETRPDFSLLSPADYDRVFQIVAKGRNAISEKEGHDLIRLISGLPTLGPDGKPTGPKIEVPRLLEDYWQRHLYTDRWRYFSFWKHLGKVETLRFLELCARYGWDENPGGKSLKERMVPLAEWNTEHRAEMSGLLDKAAA
jgi:hypothetical protein